MNDDTRSNPATLRFARMVASHVSRWPGARLLYWLLCLPLYPLLRAIFFGWHRVEVRGRNGLPPRQSGVVYLANHVSAADGPVLATSLWPRPLWFASKEGLYRGWLQGLAWMLGTALHTFPVRRDRWDESTALLFEDLVRRRRDVLLFPEGTRSRSGRLQRGRAGVGLLLLRAQPAAVVPVLIQGLERILPPGRGLAIRRRRALVRFGTPMDLGRWRDSPATRETGQAIVDAVMAEIARMRDEEEAEV